MKITKKNVRHVAKLARIDIRENQIDTMASQLSRILLYVDTLNEVDTTGVLPTFHAVSRTNAFREDIPLPHLSTEQALANAPEKDVDSGAFLVPRVIEPEVTR